MPNQSSESRLLFVDNLRIALSTLVVLHHIALVYGAASPFYYMEPPMIGLTTYKVFLVFVLFNQAFFMGFFFLLSGAGSAYALKHRTWSAYVWDRVKRLLVPLYTVGMLLFSVPILYWQEISRGKFEGSYLGFYPYYFDKIRFHSINNPVVLVNEFSELWLIVFWHNPSGIRKKRQLFDPFKHIFCKKASIVL